MGKADAPNYRKASEKEMAAGRMCGTCKAWDESATDNPETGYCEWYDFNCNRKHICDAWASDSEMNKAALDFAWDVILKARKPTNPALWSRAKAAAKKKFDVYPSAYANGWAVQWYKKRGGGWRGKAD